MKIHKIYIGNNLLPDSYLGWAESWTKHHPEADHIMWASDKSAVPRDHPYTHVCQLPPITEPIIERRLREIMPEPQIFAALSDVLRCQIVREYGGLYVDNDTVCVQDVQPLLMPCEVAIPRENSTIEACGNFLLWSRRPHHPVWRRYEDAVAKAVNGRWDLIYEKPTDFVEWTGPPMLWRAINWHPDLQILPRSQVSAFDPAYTAPTGDPGDDWPPHVYVMHFFEGSWMRRGGRPGKPFEEHPRA